MNEPQIWTLIGVFAAFLLGSFTLFTRQHDRMITSFRNELSYRFEALDVGFEALDVRFEALESKVNTRLDSIDRRLEELDKEVANLATRFWGSR